MIRVAILGSTGSIGTQTLDVIRMHPDRIRATALAAHSNEAALERQAAEFDAKTTTLFSKGGVQSLIELATRDDVDLVVVSVAGMIGLEPTIAALQSGKRIALASKEVLVAGGAVVMPIVKEAGAVLLPIDSEHSAILQCLWGDRDSPSLPSCRGVEKLILTASGGPFRGKRLAELETVTLSDALNHPTWRMGGKITIDSATMMNKGLEIIEACWLYDLPPKKIDVVVHPQSVIHSMVKFNDGSVLAQMGHPDMKLPIQFALFGPKRLPSPAKNWEPAHTPSLTFEPLDESVFICPGIAREAFAMGGVTAAFMNAVNEVAANAFLSQKIGFLTIQRINEQSLSAAPKAEPTLNNILAADEEARKWAAAKLRL